MVGSGLTQRVCRAEAAQSKLLASSGFVHAFAGVETATRAELAETLRVPEFALYEVNQVHGPVVAVAAGDTASMRRFDADALIATPEQARAVAVRTADCVPILLADLRSGAVAAVHAGWRGIEARVLGAAISALPDSAELVAAIGPHIGPCCFEVSLDVAERISNAASAAVVRRTRADKAWVDLGEAARVQLHMLGLPDTHIDLLAHCTFCSSGYHSYRRDGAAAGRQWSAIVSDVRSKTAR